MKNLIKSIGFLVFMSAFFGSEINAQETSERYNENSVNPIPYDNQLYKRTVWRRMDLREKQNQAFFSANNEITRLIIDAVKDGLIVPYVDDSLNKRMSKEKFLENLKLPTVEDDDFGATEGFGDDGWGDSGWGDESVATAEPVAQYYFPSQLTIMKIKEDMIFDKVRARLYYDIQSLEIVIPATEVATGIEKSIGVFKYKDLEQLFRSMPDRAIWYNRYNTAQHRNMADAFLLRLFSARVYKISNPNNDEIQDVYLDPKDALIKSQQLENKLIEYEHNLWEY